MSYKKSVIFFLFISVTAVNILPLFNSAVILFENKKNILNTSKKEFFSTDKFESYRNYIVYKFFNISLVDKKVIAGKDNFLFLGNAFNNVLDKTSGKFRPDRAEIDNWTDKLKTLQKWYEDKGIKFVIAIAPNKHSIYKEKLPDRLSYNGKTITDDIVDFSKKKNINLLDLRPALLKNKKQEELIYWKTDTHWNEKGAALAFEEIISYINKKHQINISIPQYSLKTFEKAAGDLSNFLKINQILPADYEKGYKYVFNNKYDICKGNINKENGILDKCIITDNPIIDPYKQTQYIINKSINNYSLLFIGDSFSVPPSQLYNTSFHTVWKWFYLDISGKKLSEFVNKNKPDLVIYQIVERDFYNPKNVPSMPDI
jgi:hypothetical protein